MTNSLEVYRRKLYAFFHHPSCVGFEEKHLGLDYPDKTFLVIQRYAPANAGLLSFYMTTLGWIRYAVAHNMTPVVDMRTWLNQCLEINEVGRLNAWEFYFNQPCGFSLEDIKSAKNILIAHDPVSPLHVYLADMLSQEEVRMEMYSLAQKYVRIKEASLVSFNNPELECALKDPTSCVIGVRARGTDYNVVRPAGHAIQPSAQCFIDKIREFPQNFKIYLVSCYLYFRRFDGRIRWMACQKIRKGK